MYQALYRKWRPRTFDDVVGQEHITGTLKNQIATGRLSHAYLFIGTRGTGKTTCAKILARAVNCEHPVNGNPCNECPACLGIEDGSVMDVVELDAASNNGVDNVRALRDEAVFTPASVKKRVYIVDEVHMLSTAAFNALLKILEEPPEHLMFILATTELQKVPATILSRCQRHSFKRLDPAVIASRLSYVADREGIALNADAAALLGRLAEGSMRDGMSLLDQCSGRGEIRKSDVLLAMGLAGGARTAELLGKIASRDAGGALELFQSLWRDGKDPATLLGELCTLQRDALMTVVAPKGGAALLSGGYDDAALRGVARAFTAEELLRNISEIQTALSGMRNSQSPKMLAELCIIRLSDPALSGDVSALAARVARLEREGPRVAPTPEPEPEPAEPEPEPVPEPETVAEPEPELEFIPEEAPELPEPEPIAEAEMGVPVKTEPVFEPGPEPVPRGEAPATGEIWPDLLNLLNGRLPMGMYALLADSYQAHGELRGDELLVTARNPFAMGQFNHPEIAAEIRRAAEELMGPVSVRFKLSDEPQGLNTAKIDALGKFGGVVRFE